MPLVAFLLDTVAATSDWHKLWFYLNFWGFEALWRARSSRGTFGCNAATLCGSRATSGSYEQVYIKFRHPKFCLKHVDATFFLPNYYDHPLKPISFSTHRFFKIKAMWQCQSVESAKDKDTGTLDDAIWSKMEALRLRWKVESVKVAKRPWSSSALVLCCCTFWLFLKIEMKRTWWEQVCYTSTSMRRYGCSLKG